MREDTRRAAWSRSSAAGGYAEYATAPADARVARSPTGVDDGTALALIVQGTTAWHLYRTAGAWRRGRRVVVHAAAGGVGSLAVQLGHALGAGRVIATASSEDKRALALRAGRRRRRSTRRRRG